jgi:hypothetical protein
MALGPPKLASDALPFPVVLAVTGASFAVWAGPLLGWWQ